MTLYSSLLKPPLHQSPSSPPSSFFPQACFSSTWYLYCRFGWWNWIQLWESRARSCECPGYYDWSNWRNFCEVSESEISPSFTILWRAPSTLQCFVRLEYLIVGTKQSPLCVLPKFVRSDLVWGAPLIICKSLSANVQHMYKIDILAFTVILFELTGVLLVSVHMMGCLWHLVADLQLGFGTLDSELRDRYTRARFRIRLEFVARKTQQEKWENHGHNHTIYCRSKLPR